MLARKLRWCWLIAGLLAPTSLPAASNDGLLFVSLAMSPDMSIRDQHIHQSILHSVMLEARRLPEVAPCGFHHLFPVQFRFGEYGLGARHDNVPTLVKCLRAAVNYLLREDIAEFDFNAARDFEVSMLRRRLTPDPADPQRADAAARRLALLAIYQRHSPLHQMHSVDGDAIAAVSYEDFMRWLERNRKSGRMTIDGSRRLLEALELPVPDPMILQLAPVLSSFRMSAGVLTFDGERVGVPALIALFLGKDSSPDYDDGVKKRFGCDEPGPSNPSDGHGVIVRSPCETFAEFGEIWLTVALRKAEGASSSEFCRQVLELSRSEDIVTAARFSADGSKGLYVLLPSACKTSD